jgi:hypothetical protein
MANDIDGQNRKTESNKIPEKQKDGWYKAEVFSKFLTAILVVIIGFMGNKYLQEIQKNDNDLNLYTQLLSNKETSENTLRKDMFVKILDSFLETKKDENKSKEGSLSKISNMRLNLELLSRNFHESLDKKPLFKHLLIKIIRPREALKNLLAEMKKYNAITNDNPRNPKHLEDIYQEARILTNNEIDKINLNKNETIPIT